MPRSTLVRRSLPIAVTVALAAAAVWAWARPPADPRGPMRREDAARGVARAARNAPTGRGPGWQAFIARHAASQQYRTSSEWSQDATTLEVRSTVDGEFRLRNGLRVDLTWRAGGRYTQWAGVTHASLAAARLDGDPIPLLEAAELIECAAAAP